MTDGGKWRDEEHSRAYVAHHTTDILATVGTIAVGGTFAAAGLGLAVRTAAKTRERIVEQSGTVVAQSAFGSAMLLAAVDAYHLLYCPLFASDPVQS